MSGTKSGVRMARQIWDWGRAADSIGGFLRGRPRVVPHVPDGLRIYAVGDVHGRADCLARVFAEIDAESRRRPVDEAVEIYLGDYVDRGPDSRAVIDLLIGRAARRHVVPLLGNHEAMLLAALATDRGADASTEALSQTWRRSGALDTLTSYNVTCGGQAAREEDWPAIVAAFRQNFPATHHAFLAGSSLSVSCGSYFFAHAGIRPGIPLDDQQTADLCWIREPFLTSRADHGAIIVHGHTPTHGPELHTNRINVDTGAYLTGHLGCVALEGGAQHIICG